MLRKRIDLAVSYFSRITHASFFAHFAHRTQAVHLCGGPRFFVHARSGPRVRAELGFMLALGFEFGFGLGLGVRG